MQRRLVAASMTLLLLASFGVPSVEARCPDPPRDCSSIISPELINVGTSELNVGVYKNDPQTNGGTSYSDRDDAAATADDGGLHVGDRGGILVVVKTVGNAESFELTFPASPPGITWTNGAVLRIDNPTADGHYLLPFRVTAVTPGQELTFTAKDNLGNQAPGSIAPFGLLDEHLDGVVVTPAGLPSWILTVLVFGTLLGVLALLPKMRR